ncbi:hypothetical protein FOA43_000556 [Brettanomyces nanus]|uniref:L-type lectin-like domain-containing protein n=1 Tax=Eeniella nana TaxID=13502 RepID=A0A875RXB0_EENNA|nr:uncharacterized protein FOA43_000556 [Brettanomyces nanus]QPG73248.1 hypothetical protein FOA43_000556 [Brettanomyces nanus]
MIPLFNRLWLLVVASVAVLLVAQVSAHGDSQQQHPIEDQYEDSIVDPLSLPELVKVQKIDELQNNWLVQDSAEFFEGRILLTPKPVISSSHEHETSMGSMWSLPSKKKAGLDEVEIQLTLRSIGSFGKTGAGFSFFMVNDDDKAFAAFNKNSFGGPSKFSGLQVSLDSNHPQFGPVLRVYLNDGSKDIQLDHDYLGAYRYEYQVSNVPLTLKIGYARNWLKITCDNKMLFETNKVSLDSVIQSPYLRLGLTASSPKDVKRYEQFELLRLKSYNQVSTELRLDTKGTLMAKHAERSSIEPTNKFRNKVEAMREKLNQATADSSGDSSSLLGDILAKISSIEGTLLQQQTSPEGSEAASSVQTNLQKQIFLLSKTMERLTDNINNVLRKNEEFYKHSEILERKYDNLQALLERQAELLVNAETSSKTIGKAFTQKIDSLVLTLGGIHTEYLSGLNAQNPQFEAKLNALASFIKIIFLPLVCLCFIIVFLMYKLRNDIKHAKVL